MGVKPAWVTYISSSNFDKFKGDTAADYSGANDDFIILSGHVIINPWFS